MLFAFIQIHAQGKVSKLDTAEFKVAGACNMCKERIEDAALSKGVKNVEWNKESRILTVIYRSDKTAPEKVGKRLAGFGHDNEYFAATEASYKKLPKCCRYRTVSTH